MTDANPLTKVVQILNYQVRQTLFSPSNSHTGAISGLDRNQKCRVGGALCFCALLVHFCIEPATARPSAPPTSAAELACLSRILLSGSPARSDHYFSTAMRKTYRQSTSCRVETSLRFIRSTNKQTKKPTITQTNLIYLKQVESLASSCDSWSVLTLCEGRFDILQGL